MLFAGRGKIRFVRSIDGAKGACRIRDSVHCETADDTLTVSERKPVQAPGMKITASGMELEVPAGSTIERLLDILGETVRQDMIVELNRRFIHVRDYSTTIVKESDVVEIIHLAFGG